MKIAIVSLTENGLLLSERLAAALSCEHLCFRFAYEKHCDNDAASFTDMKKLTAYIFKAFDGIIFFCSCGIAVRMLAPHLVSKLSDPAVVVVDEQGKYAVSLLSGHIGGANVLAEQVSNIIGAKAVITTATDVGGKFSPDSFAEGNNLIITDMKLAKELAAAVVNGDKIGIKSDYPCLNTPPEFDESATEYGICISPDTSKNPFAKTLHLIPKNIIVGIGCKKNTPSDALEAFILSRLSANRLSINRLCELHSIDLKVGEKAILDFCQKYKIKFKTYSAEELMRALGEFSHSDFVMRTTGADNICERSAVIGENALIVRKIAESGMTFAAAEKRVEIDFERRIL